MRDWRPAKCLTSLKTLAGRDRCSAADKEELEELELEGLQELEGLEELEELEERD